jgi:hypothetical protein
LVFVDQFFQTVRSAHAFLLWPVLKASSFSRQTTILPKNNIAGTSKRWLLTCASFARCAIPVPKNGLSQLDSRNQEALAFVHSILKGVSSDERPSKSTELTANGLFQSKKFPTDFFCAPVYMGGWPKPMYDPAASQRANTKSSRSHQAHTAAAAAASDNDEDGEEEEDNSLA